MTLSAKGGYAYEFHNKGITGTMSYVGVPGWNPTAIQGVKPGRHSWNVGGGIKYETKRIDVAVDYSIPAVQNCKTISLSSSSKWVSKNQSLIFVHGLCFGWSNFIREAYFQEPSE